MLLTTSETRRICKRQWEITWSWQGKKHFKKYFCIRHGNRLEHWERNASGYRVRRLEKIKKTIDQITSEMASNNPVRSKVNPRMHEAVFLLSFHWWINCLHTVLKDATMLEFQSYLYHYNSSRVQNINNLKRQKPNFLDPQLSVTVCGTTPLFFLCILSVGIPHLGLVLVLSL